MADLVNEKQQNISLHLANIFDEKEFQKKSVMHTAQDGKEYITSHYNLNAILAVEYCISTKKGTEFRQ
ncbi:hypothetical protein DID76_00245 [Candidatus Marinamargulisbacteria bacterium SCGC AG-414-C22]|nr:hypothetical protein DID76_00245 [Candidatus Marinamargulisbacteria bacterium SCGC AG-414-C22]